MAKNANRGKSSFDFKVGPIPLALMSEDSAAKASDLVSVIVFEAGENMLAVGVEQTEGVVDCPRISPLPSAPDGMVGVTSVRGRITLVMDLSHRAAISPSKRRRLILLKGDMQLGLLADRVEDVVALPPKKVRLLEEDKKTLAARMKQGHGWPARSFFKHEGRDVPIIEVEALAQA